MVRSVQVGRRGGARAAPSRRIGSNYTVIQDVSLAVALTRLAIHGYARVPAANTLCVVRTADLQAL